MQVSKYILSLFLFFFWAEALSAQQVYRRVLRPDVQAPANGKFRVAFFDADSTLRVAKTGRPTANKPSDVLLIPRVGRTIAKLNRIGYLVVVVSNQGGIPKFVSLENADAALRRMIKLIAVEGGRVDYYDFAEFRNQDRKPNIGMARRLERVLKLRFGSSVSIDKSRSFMVGDSAYKKAINGKPADIRPDGRPGFNFSNSDRFFARNYGIRFYEPQKFFGWERYGVELIDHPDDLKKLIQARPYRSW